MKVLVGIEDSQSAADLEQAIVRQFQPAETTIRVLHVLQPFVAGVPPQMAKGYAPELETQKKEAYPLVEKFATRLRNAGFTVETAIELGDIRNRLIDDANESHSDLIIVGSHGHKGVHRFFLGSVAEFVARNASCSVEVVRSAVAH